MSVARAAVLGLLLIATPAFAADVALPSAIPGLAFTSMSGVVPAGLGAPVAASPAVPTLPSALAADASAPRAETAAVPSAPAETALESASAAGAAAAGASGAEQAGDAASQGFDGAAALAAGADPGAPSLVAADPAQAPRLEEVLAVARRSKTARAVLARVEALTRERGRPLIVAIGGVGSSAAAEYALDHEVVTLGRDSLKQEPEAVVPMLFHELQHALQYAEDMPSGAVETELDSYLVQFRVAEELGWRAPRSHFQTAALRRLKGGVDRLVEYVRKAYPRNLGLVGSSAKEYETKLASRRARLDRQQKRLIRELKEKDVVLARMRETGQTAEAIRRFELDERAPILVRQRDNEDELRWADRDLAILRDPERLARYRAYASSVMRRARAYHDKLVRG